MEKIKLPTIDFLGAKIGLKEGQKIRKLEVATIETLNRELLGVGSQIKELQDRLEEVYNNIEKNKADFAEGKIERLTFNKDEDMFFKEKAKATDELRAVVRKGTEVIAQMKINLDNQRIE